MNNEEKKPIAGEEVMENTSQASDSSASAKASGFGGWWKSLTVGIKAAIIAGIACVLIAVVVLIAVLGGGKGPDGPSGGPGGNNGGSGKTVTYSITVVTKGGMALNKLPVYIHEIEDGSIGDMVDGGYGATDENGKVNFKLPEGGEYAAVINNTVALDGYDALDFYPLVSADLKIVISSSVIPETSLSGITYNPGSVMHDFTVNSTVLVDDGKVGLREKRFLGEKIVFHCAVKIKMVLGEVREDQGFKRQKGDALLDCGMGGKLHDQSLCPEVDKPS